MSDLKALNPNVNINKLSVGQVLNVKELIPRLSVRTVEHVTYTEPIPCPVQTKDDPTIYVGSSKIITKGVEGEAEVTANVTRVNGGEKERDVLESRTPTEPTTTIKAVGTKPKPKTASNGYYKWPCRGKITSYFGYRRIFGSRSYHSGIDIAAPKGTAIKAADGGKVTFSGTKGNYGKLVIITHDDGTQTYYGHCSSLLVSAGERVYQGQTIAKVGSTGRSTGNHCHFEVRIKGSSVNPLNYLP
jgi:murein DD-endopeptidase MepM/ murein hydrolase activator NlpD